MDLHRYGFRTNLEISLWMYLYNINKSMENRNTILLDNFLPVRACSKFLKDLFALQHEERNACSAHQAGMMDQCFPLW